MIHYLKPDPKPKVIKTTDTGLFSKSSRIKTTDNGLSYKLGILKLGINGEKKVNGNWDIIQKN